MALRLLVLLALAAAPVEPVEARYRGTRIVRIAPGARVKSLPQRARDPQVERARFERADALTRRKLPDICKGC